MSTSTVPEANGKKRPGFSGRTLVDAQTGVAKDFRSSDDYDDAIASGKYVTQTSFEEQAITEAQTGADPEFQAFDPAPSTGKIVKDFGDGDKEPTPPSKEFVPERPETTFEAVVPEVKEPTFTQAKRKKLGRKSTLLTGGRGVKGKARTKKALLGGA